MGITVKKIAFVFVVTMCCFILFGCKKTETEKTTKSDSINSIETI